MTDKTITTWPAFEHFIAWLANIGFYVRWTASEYEDLSKGIYLLDSNDNDLNDGFIAQMSERGFVYISSESAANGMMLRKFKSQPIMQQ